MNALIKIRCFLGLVRVEEGDFCALQTLELLVISFLEAIQPAVTAPETLSVTLCTIYYNHLG